MVVTVISSLINDGHATLTASSKAFLEQAHLHFKKQFHKTRAQGIRENPSICRAHKMLILSALTAIWQHCLPLYPKLLFFKKKKNQEEKYYSFSYFVATLIFKGVFKALSHGVFLKEHKFYYSCFLFINKTHIQIEI